MDNERFKIMVGGKAISSISDCQLTFKKDDLKKLDEPREGFWRQHVQPMSWDVTCASLIKESVSNPLEELFRTHKEIEVTIMQEIGKLPRKMKKAFNTDPGRCTKWGRKLENYLKRITYYGRGGEIVLTKADQETLCAQFKFDKFERGCDIEIEGETIQKAISKYSRRKHNG